MLSVHPSSARSLAQSEEVRGTVAVSRVAPGVHVSTSTGRTAYRSSQSAPSRRMPCERITLARFFTRTQGRIRNRLLLTTRCRFRSRAASSHPIHASRAAIRQAGLENCRQPTTCRSGRDPYTRYWSCAPNGTACPR